VFEEQRYTISCGALTQTREYPCNSC